MRHTYYVLMGDLVDSRSYDSKTRQELQLRLMETMKWSIRNQK